MELNILGGSAPHIDELDIAHFFLYLAKKEKQHLTQQKLHKLIFLTVAFGLHFFSKRPIKTQTVCWMYGPIYPKLYQRFKYQLGNDLTLLYQEKTLSEMSEIIRNCTQLEHVHQAAMLVWDKYKQTPGIELSDKCWKLLYPKPNWFRDMWNQKVRKTWLIPDTQLLAALNRLQSNSL